MVYLINKISSFFIQSNFFFVTVHKIEVPPCAQHKVIFGVIGTIKLIAGNYLVVVTGRKKIGTINGQTIWTVTNTEVLSYTKTNLHLNEKQVHILIKFKRFFHPLPYTN